MRRTGLLFALAGGVVASAALVSSAFLGACIDADGLDTGHAGESGDATVITIVGDSGIALLPDGACAANVQSDTRNCGQCGKVCGASETDGGPVSTAFTCNAGQCVSTCASGFGDCNGDGTDGCETALTASATNCGACGHTCGGSGACTNGQCQPETIATITGATVGRLIVDDQSVYFVSAAPPGVWRLPKTGGAATELSDAGVAPNSIGQVGNHLYIADPGIPNASTLLVDGGAAMPLAADTVTNFASNGARVFWSGLVPTLSGVSTYDSDAGVVVLYNTPETPYHLAAASSAVYSLGQNWLVTAPAAGAPTSDTVYRCELPSCQADAGAFAVGQSRSYAIATDDVNVYWTAQNTGNGDGFIAYCPIAACPAAGPTKLVTGLAEPTNVIADGTSVIWIESSAAAVRSFPAPQTTTASGSSGSGTTTTDAGKTADGGGTTTAPVAPPSTRTLGYGLRSVQHLAVDDMYVYWTLDSGTIQRVRK